MPARTQAADAHSRRGRLRHTVGPYPAPVSTPTAARSPGRSRRASVPRRRAVPDFDAISAAAPVVVLLVVGTLRKGAFFKPDVVVLACLCLALAFVSPVVLRWVGAHPLPSLAGAGAVLWWVADAVAGGHPIESWRMPATWVCAAAGYGVVRALPSGARRAVALAVTVFGCATSALGLVFVAARSTMWTWPDERSLRFQGPLTYPSAVALFLLLALLASAVACPTNSRTASLTRALILLGVVATDSRGAIAAFGVLLLFRRVRQVLVPAIVIAVVAAPLVLFGQRGGVRPVCIAAAVLVIVGLSALPERLRRKGIWFVTAPALGIAAWLLATQHHAVSGLDASWTERGHILRGAVSLFVSHPVFGAGPDPWIPTKTLTGAAGVDAFAHNEYLELLVSVGVVGTVGLAVAAFVVVRALWGRRGFVAAPALVAVGVAGLFDFVWHFPALGLMAGVVAACGCDVLIRPDDAGRIRDRPASSSLVSMR